MGKSIFTYKLWVSPTEQDLLDPGFGWGSGPQSSDVPIAKEVRTAIGHSQNRFLPLSCKYQKQGVQFKQCLLIPKGFRLGICHVHGNTRKKGSRVRLPLSTC